MENRLIWSWGLAVAALSFLGCSGSDRSEDGSASSGLEAGSIDSDRRTLDVLVYHCAEWVGIGGIPASAALAAVPPEFTPAGDAAQAVLVVRVVECGDVVVARRHLGRTRTTQIGVNLTGPDTAASINNYTLWYTTDQPLLAAWLNAAGARARLARDLDFFLRPSGELRIRATAARAPTFTVRGTAVPPVDSPVEFTASWWALDGKSEVRAHTTFPEIQFGVAHTELTTPPRSELADLIGGTTLTFALLDSYNTFDAAELEVSHVD